MCDVWKQELLLHVDAVLRRCGSSYPFPASVICNSTQADLHCTEGSEAVAAERWAPPRTTAKRFSRWTRLVAEALTMAAELSSARQIRLKVQQTRRPCPSVLSAQTCAGCEPNVWHHSKWRVDLYSLLGISLRLGSKASLVRGRLATPSRVISLKGSQQCVVASCCVKCAHVIIALRRVSDVGCDVHSTTTHA